MCESMHNLDGVGRGEWGEARFSHYVHESSCSPTHILALSHMNLVV